MSTDAMIEDEVLEEIWWREIQGCESAHTWINNPRSSCTVIVTHVLKCPATVSALVCAHTARAYAELVEHGVLCSRHGGLQADHLCNPI